MAKITQYSRISHHTLAGSASATFSVPVSEDFTDGSWTPADLALSEIGVNEDAGKAYIRIGSDIKEIEFVGATSGAENLATTLAAGNTTGPNHIYFNDGYGLYNNNQIAFIRFNDTPGSEIYHNVNNGTSSTDVFHTSNYWYVNTNQSGKNNYIYQDESLVEINCDDNSGTASNFQMEADRFYIETADGVGTLGSSLTATMSGVNIQTTDLGYGQTSSISITKNTIYVGYTTDNDAWYSNMSIDGTSPETKIETGYNSGSQIGRVRTQPGLVGIYTGNATASNDYVATTQQNNLFRVLRVDNDVEVSEIKIGSVDSNNVVNVNQTNFMYGTTSTTGYASASIVSLELPDTGDHAWVKVYVKAINATYSKAYGADIFGAYRNDGTLKEVGSGYAVIEYTDFTGGAQAYIDISGDFIRVRALGETSSNITWSANLTWG